ncbi:CPBP family intramembrane glutamic endopeptidase [Anaerobaca lacustris]|uniref:CPBP family intramembrane metalloprotease n=1 Tax=Anaerobaca lacustris TaxID=3044600 RepID=A0AAW6U1I8_9BACT|nr:CPBP family intramembrane metalloprotease [Sedimentisphaerales bacterium M17dextr]
MPWEEVMGESEHQAEPLHELNNPHAVEGGSAPDASSPAGPDGGDTPEPELYAGNRPLSLLFNTRTPVWRYILRAGLLSLVPSLLVSFLIAGVGLGNEETMPQFDRAAGPVVLFVMVVVVSPVVETLVLGFGLWLLAFLTRKLLWQALGSSVIWAILHSLAAPAWGLVVLWPFFVFSCAYLAWRRRSLWHAMGVACGVHVFQNLLPGILIATM